jgi:hypothetical protein
MAAAQPNALTAGIGAAAPAKAKALTSAKAASVMPAAKPSRIRSRTIQPLRA